MSIKRALPLLLPLCLPVPLCAQDPDSVVLVLRERCRTSAEIVREGPSNSHYRQAVLDIWSCSQRLDLFPQLWSNATQAPLSVVYYMTLSARDRRAYDVVWRYAQDAAQRDDVRIAAMGVLGSWLHPGLAPNWGDLRTDTMFGRVFDSGLWVRYFDGVQPIAAAEPLPSNAAEQIRALIGAIANSDPNELIRASAKVLSSMIASGGIVPFEPHLVSGEQYCERYWRIWNYGGMDGYVEFRVLGTDDMGTIVAPARDTTMFRALRSGPVELRFGREPIDTLEYIEAPCLRVP